MYIGYLHDRKLLGYPASKDTSCGIKLVLIADSTVLLIGNLLLNVAGNKEKNNGCHLFRSVTHFW